MKILTLAANLVCLNILWLLCSLPIVTAGASTAAMYYVVFQYINDQDDAVLKPFLKAFKENFRTATPVWMLNLLIGLALAAGIPIMIFLMTGAKMPILPKRRFMGNAM